MSSETKYDPISYENIGWSIIDRLLSEEVLRLSDLVNVGRQVRARKAARFTGAGLYVIYYAGSLPNYSRLAVLNRDGRFEAPIYVGKADPAGARKGRESDERETTLFLRLVAHARSISQVANLELADFSCRYLVLVDTWIRLGERHLINRHRPVWSVVADGFGNNAAGAGRERGRRSRWDTIHPGRPWAMNLPDNYLSANEIWERIDRALAGDATALLEPEDQLAEAQSDEE